ncbi:cancer/testis antigen 1-like isoform X1 [Prionailurus bengalensis]|uniref:cancer/testis antigen 1-like isoform X1 n=1 Tax=Prionailurus bengalensis TaxID=37029 RepID=UPI001CA8A08E|nr:cancer/testis antigen 1-like isoform X1 [Prionailurus bengalensis]XP_043426304.1 cancer/testis antigen 1-like isoform X1 [Prionailurus bengalensis]XP_043426310.1 cancer/testis antigen 1-like isoform X1 [Prionailurus bengalensis]XP_043426313.1 cancer/testis antigen 1-like isoform X1 [Prionailurus bengalensis]
MEATDRGAGGGAGGPEGQRGPGDPGVPDGPGGHEGPGGGRGGEGEECAAAGAAPRVAQAPCAPVPGAAAVPGLGGHPLPGPGGHGGPTAGGPGSQPLQFYVTMPFPSSTEAQVAHQCLATQGQPQVGAVRKEFTVFGNVLIIRLTAEDPGQLQVSIASCLDQLSLLVWTMQRFVPPFFRVPEPGKRG